MSLKTLSNLSHCTQCKVKSKSDADDTHCTLIILRSTTVLPPPHRSYPFTRIAAQRSSLPIRRNWFLGLICFPAFNSIMIYTQTRVRTKVNSQLSLSLSYFTLPAHFHQNSMSKSHPLPILSISYSSILMCIIHIIIICAYKGMYYIRVWIPSTCRLYNDRRRPRQPFVRPRYYVHVIRIIFPRERMGEWSEERERYSRPGFVCFNYPSPPLCATSLMQKRYSMALPRDQYI